MPLKRENWQFRCHQDRLGNNPGAQVGKKDFLEVHSSEVLLVRHRICRNEMKERRLELLLKFIDGFRRHQVGGKAFNVEFSLREADDVEVHDVVVVMCDLWV